MPARALSPFELRMVHRVLDGDPDLLAVIGRNAHLRSYWRELLARYRASLLDSVERGEAAGNAWRERRDDGTRFARRRHRRLSV